MIVLCKIGLSCKKFNEFLHMVATSHKHNKLTHVIFSQLHTISNGQSGILNLMQMKRTKNTKE